MRILLVEDEVLVAMDLSMAIERMGHEVLGPVHRLATGLTLAEREQIDLAILDLNLSGEFSFPIAQILRERGVPHVFLTGYQLSQLPEEYRDAPLLPKPVSHQELERSIDAALAEARC